MHRLIAAADAARAARHIIAGGGREPGRRHARPGSRTTPLTSSNPDLRRAAARLRRPGGGGL